MNGNTSARIDHSLKAISAFCSPGVIAKLVHGWEGGVYVFGMKPRKAVAFSRIAMEKRKL